MATVRDFLTRAFYTGNKELVQIITPSGSRLNVTTAAGASSAAAALPTGATALRVAATEACWIRFGAAGVGAAAADANSMYFPAGAEVMGIPVDTAGAAYTHVRVIRAGSNETTAQFEAVA